jgi:DNA-binding transcriptional regulator YdaS (Cro superfamily)
MSKTKHDAQPAMSVVLRLGGCRAVARLVGVSPSAVSRWCTPAPLGGTGGRIPQRHWGSLIAQAAERGVVLDAQTLAGLPRPS